MINFVINSDDNLKDEITKTINNVMMSNSLDYHVSIFDDSKDLLEKDSSSNKIYILDIDINKNGLDIAKEIRNNDITSYIIILTNHDNYSGLFRSMIMPINVINKFMGFKDQLGETIAFLIKHFLNDNRLIVKHNGIIHNININDVLYITKDSLSRRTIIVTNDNEIQCNIPLSEFENKNFIKTHRACIVNIKNIQSIDFVENKITFNNNKMIDLLSRRKHKILKDKFTNNNF